MFYFKDVIGQQSARARLIQEVQEGRVPHAQLFCGPAGTGKLPLALAYARYLCCTHPTGSDACGTCPSCVKWNKLMHPDVHFMFPIVRNAKAKKEVCDDYLAAWRRLLTTHAYFSLDDWLNEMDADNGQAIIYARESDEITRKLSLKAVEGGYKITVVWLPEKLHEVCANKLLKLLEEPPARTVFLLVSEAPDQILTTIQSRTQRFGVPRIAEADIAEALRTRYGVQQADSEAIAHMANGSFTQALQAISLNEENQLFFELFVGLMRQAYARKVRDMKQWSEQLAGMGRERQKHFLDYCQRMLRENFIYNLHCPEMNYMTRAEENFATRFAPFINVRNVAGIMHELEEAQRHIAQNVNPRMVFFDFALKMIVLLKA